jgi:tetratricopeptide (TPR) repeat protein
MPAILLLLAFMAAPDTDVRAAEASLAKGEYRKALQMLEAIARSEPASDPEIWVMMAVAHWNLGEKTAAVETCEHGLAIFPTAAGIATYYVSLLPEALPAPEARARIEQALERSSESGVLKKALGKALLDSNPDDPRIERLLAAARTILPADPEAHYLYGRWACLHQKERPCSEALAKSLSLSPANNYSAATLLNGMIGVAEDRLGKAGEARAAFERALAAYRRLEPPVPDVPYQYVRFLIDRGESADAERVNAVILSRNPEFAPSHLEQAKFLLRAGKRDEAVAEALTALERPAADRAQLRAIHVFLVKAYSSLGREKEAQRHQEWVDAHQ